MVSGYGFSHTDAERKKSALAGVQRLKACPDTNPPDEVASRLSQLAKQNIRTCFEGQSAAVCLACTELPLAFRGMQSNTSFHYEDVLYINTTLAHIEAAFELAVAP